MASSDYSNLCSILKSLSGEKNLLLLAYSLHRISLTSDMNLLYNGVGINCKCNIFRSYFAQSGGKFPPQENENFARQQEADNSQESDYVVFTLDNAEKVKANRNILIAKSHFFAAMLEGHYVEREKNEISIPHTNHQPFNAVIQLIQGLRTEFDKLLKDCECASSRISRDESLEILLEILELCDRYLLSDFKQDIANILFRNLVSGDNVVRMLHFGMKHNCSLLVQRCISYVLLKEAVPLQRYHWMRDMFLTDDVDGLIQCVKELFQTHMSTRMEICKV